MGSLHNLTTNREMVILMFKNTSNKGDTVTKAEVIMIRLWEELVPQSDTSTFILRGAGRGTTGTPSSRDIQSYLNAKTYTHGKEFVWDGPHKLHIKTGCIDNGLLDLLKVQSADQQ